jgi:hypothetical protein
MFALLLCTATSFTTQAPQSSVREELAKYYQTGERPTSWNVSIKNLAAANAADRRQAVDHLVCRATIAFPG